MLRLLIILAALTIAIAQVGLAADPSSPEQRPEPTTQRGGEWSGSMGFPEQVLVGRVSDSKGTPIEGVIVKLFASGKLIQAARSSASGDFEMKIPLNLDADETVTIWFVPTTGSMMPKMVLLKKSSSAHKAGLFSQCVDEFRLTQQTRIDVKLLQENEYIANIKAKGCL